MGTTIDDVRADILHELHIRGECGGGCPDCDEEEAESLEVAEKAYWEEMVSGR